MLSEIRVEKLQRIRLEASSLCQLRCISCPRQSDTFRSIIGNGFLTIKDFTSLIEKQPCVRDVELSNYGEVFLNPELLQIMRYANENKVRLWAKNGVNLNNIKYRDIEGLVKYGFRYINCSIDGASSKTYESYRIKGDFEKVLNNIRTINRLKRKYATPYPFMRWQFIVFGHNEHEIPVARKLAKSLSMDFSLKLSWDEDFSPVRDKEMIRNEIGYSSRTEYKALKGYPYLQSICHQLWDSPQINWDGKILGCCRNFWKDFGGNAFIDGLVESINSEKISYARKMLLGKVNSRHDIPCVTCDIYRNMKETGNYLSR